MKILCTGAFGFIGSQFVKMLIEDYPEVEVRAFVRNSDQRKSMRLAPYHNHPRLRLIIGDLTDVNSVSGLVEGVDVVVNFAAKSIAENMYVPIKSVIGTRTITFRELWNQQSINHTPQKKGGNEVITLKGKQTKALSFYNGGQWMPIRKIMRHKFKGNLLQMEQKWGSITATDNHSIYSANLELSTPKDNPELLSIRKINENNKKYKVVSKELLFILAAYITEGCATFNKASGGYVVVIAQKEREWLEKLQRAIRIELGLKAYVSKKIQSGVYRLELTNKKFFHYVIKNCGKLSINKCFPNWIFDLTPQLREYFWSKLLEGDGTKDGRYGTVSEKLANQISLLLALQGKEFKVVKQRFKNPNWNDVFHFRTNQNNHYGLNKRKVNKIDYSGWVYDLEIEKSHNFVCGWGNIVCHNTFVDHSIKDASAFVQSNIIGTYNLLEESRRNRVGKYVQVSTDEVYGSILEGAYKEDAPLNPTNPYSATKAAADMLVQSYGSTYGLKYIITRTENNYGKFQHPQKAMPVFVKNALNDVKIPVYGDGGHMRQWIRVEDHCLAIMHLISLEKEGVFHVAGEQELQNVELAERILSILKKPKSLIEFVPDFDIRPGHDRRYALNCDKLKSTGWRPKWDLQDGLEDAVKWYKENDWWLYG